MFSEIVFLSPHGRPTRCGTYSVGEVEFGAEKSWCGSTISTRI